jgi:hypothetical protein
VADRVLGHAHLADEPDADARLLLDLAHRGLGDALSFFDPAARDHCRVLRHPRDVEDEQLVGARLGVLAGDVGGDRRAGSQLFSARSLAL